MVAVAQTRGIAPSLLVSPTEAVRTGPPPRYRWILVSPSAAGLDYRCRPLQRPGFVQQPPGPPRPPLRNENRRGYFQVSLHAPTRTHIMVSAGVAIAGA